MLYFQPLFLLCIHLLSCPFFLCLTSAYQIVVEELHPHRTKRETGAMECYQIPVTYQTALSGGSPYYFAAQLPPGNLPEPAPFTVGDNRTYQGFWNPPLAPRKGYNIYFQAMSSVEKASADNTFLLGAVKDKPVVTGLLESDVGGAGSGMAEIPSVL